MFRIHFYHREILEKYRIFSHYCIDIEKQRIMVIFGKELSLSLSLFFSLKLFTINKDETSIKAKLNKLDRQMNKVSYRQGVVQKESKNRKIGNSETFKYKHTCLLWHERVTD